MSFVCKSINYNLEKFRLCKLATSHIQHEILMYIKYIDMCKGMYK